MKRSKVESCLQTISTRDELSKENRKSVRINVGAYSPQLLIIQVIVIFDTKLATMLYVGAYTHYHSNSTRDLFHYLFKSSD